MHIWDLESQDSWFTPKMLTKWPLNKQLAIADTCGAVLKITLRRLSFTWRRIFYGETVIIWDWLIWPCWHKCQRVPSPSFCAVCIILQQKWENEVVILDAQRVFYLNDKTGRNEIGKHRIYMLSIELLASRIWLDPSLLWTYRTTRPQRRTRHNKVIE